MEFWVSVGIVIVIILILLWFINYFYKNNQLEGSVFHETYDWILNSGKKTYDQYFEDPERLYEKTVGYQNNETVKMALEKALKKEEMYLKNEAQATISREKIGDAIVNSFVIGDLMRFNNRQNSTPELVNLHYHRALNRIANFPRESVDAKLPLPAEFIIERVEEWDRRQALTNPPRDYETLRTRVREARLERAARVAQESKETKKMPVSPQALYFAEKPVPNDPQNVHDAEVNFEIKNIYQKIREKNQIDYRPEAAEDSPTPARPTNAQIIEEIRRELTNAQISQDKRERALRILQKFTQGGMYSNLEAKEDDIVSDVWLRIKSSENEKNRDSLKQTFFDSLADGMEKDSYGTYREVCLVGRCNRVIQSLTLSDADQDIAKPVETTEILRNEVFSKSYQVLQNELKKAPAEIAEKYNQGDESPPVQEFTENVKKEIEKTLREDHKNVNQTTLDNLIKDALAGV